MKKRLLFLASIIGIFTIISYNNRSSNLPLSNQTAAIYATYASTTASSASTLYVPSGSSASVSWSVPNVSSCVVTKNGVTVASSTATTNVYITDSSNNRIQKFSSFGTYLSQFGSTGSGNGQFNQPTGISFDSLGNLYVGDGSTSTAISNIQKFNSSGTFLSKLNTSGFYLPYGMVTDSSGKIYVADAFGNRIIILNPDGTTSSTFGTSGSGNGQFFSPYGVALDSSGNIYVADLGNNRIQKFNSDGSYNSQFGTYGAGNGQFYSPWAIAIDSSNDIYVSDTGNNRVQKFNSSGTYISQFGTTGSGNGQFSQPAGIVFDVLGNIYVADLKNHRVQKFTSSGTYLSQFGTSGTGNGQFKDPFGIITLSSVDGTLDSGPITAPTFFIISCPTWSEGVTIDVLPTPGGVLAKNASYTNQTVAPNTTAIKIGSYVFSAGSSEAIRITNLTVDLTGTISETSLSNLYVKVNGISYTPVAPQFSNNFSVDFTVPVNASYTIDVYADIGSVTGTLKTTLTASGYGVTSNLPIASSAQGQIITVSSGNLSVSVDPSLTSGNILPGNSVALARYTFTNTSATPATISNITTNIAAIVTGSGLSSGEKVYLFENGTLISTYTVSSSSSESNPVFNSGTGLFTIPANSSVTVDIRADIGSTDFGTVRTSITGITANVPALAAFPIIGPSMTIVGPEGSLAKNGSYANQTVAPNTTAVKIGSYVFQAGSSEAIRITNLTVDLTGTISETSLSNLYVKVDGVSYTPVSPQASNSFSVDFTTAANASKIVDIYADISNASGTTGTTLTASGYGVTSNLPITKFVVGQIITASSGPTITPDGVLTKIIGYDNQIISPNTNNLKTGRYLFSASSSEAIRITTITVNISGSIPLTDISNLYTVINGIATNPINPLSSNNFSVDFTVPANSIQNIDVLMDIGSATGTITTTLTASGYGVTSNLPITRSATGQTITVLTATSTNYTPIINSISSNQGSGGSIITVNGSNFSPQGAGMQIQFLQNGVLMSSWNADSVSGNQLQFSISGISAGMLGTNTYQLRVANWDGVNSWVPSNSLPFTIIGLATTNATISAASTTISNNASTTISFGSTNANSCMVTKNGVLWSTGNPANNIHVTDTNNNRVEIFDSSGTYLSSFGTTGSGNGQFNKPQGTAFDSAGNVYVVDRGNSRVQKFTSSGTYLFQFGSVGWQDGKFSNPYGIALDSSGNIYVVDNSNNRVEKFNPDGTYNSKFSTVVNGMSNFKGIAFDSSGNIYLTSAQSNTVNKFNSSGVFQSKFGSYGTGNGQFKSSPIGIAIDSSNNIYVADTGNNRIQKFNPDGSYNSQFGTFGSGNGQFNGPNDLTLDSFGNIYVTDTGNNRIEKFSSSGIYISQFGTSGSGNGQFDKPSSMDIDPSINSSLDSGVLVTDTTFTTTCVGPLGTTTNSVVVNVTNPSTILSSILKNFENVITSIYNGLVSIITNIYDAIFGKTTETVTVSPEGSLAKNGSYTNQTVSPNTTVVKIGSYVFQAGSSEAIRITNLTVDLTGTISVASLSNLYVKVNGISYTPVNPQASNNFSVDFTVPANGNYTIDVYADISNASGTTGTTLTASGYGVTSNLPITKFVVGQIITVLASTTCSTVKSNFYSMTFPSQFVIGGTTAPIALYGFVTSSSSSKITQMSFDITGGVDFISAGGINVPVVLGQATITGLNINIPTGPAGVQVPVVATYSTVGLGGSISGDVIKTSVKLTGFKYTDSCNNLVPVSGLNLNSNQMTLVGSKPKVTVLHPVQQDVGAGGQVIVARVTVAADSHGAIDLINLPIKLVASATASGTNIGTVGWVRIAGSGFIASTTGGIAVLGNGATATSTITFTGTGYQIPAGSSVTFEIWGNVTGSSDDTIKTSLAQKDLFSWRDVIGNAIADGTNILPYPINSGLVTFQTSMPAPILTTILSSTSSPISQFVIGGTTSLIGTFNSILSANGASAATITELGFILNPESSTAITSITVGGVTSMVVPGATTTVTGLNILVPVSSSGTNIPVTVTYNTVGTSTGGIPSTQTVQLKLASVKFTSGSVTAINYPLAVTVTSNLMTLVASKPTVTVLHPANREVETTGSAIIARITVTASNSPIDLINLPIRVVASVTGSTNVGTTGQVRIAGSGAVASTTGGISAVGTAATDVITFAGTGYQIPAGSSVTFEIWGEVGGSYVDGSTVSLRIPDRSLFIWRDVVGNATTTGAYIFNFPTNTGGIYNP